MKYIQITILGFSLLSFSVVFGQTAVQTLNQANKRDGESVEYCHQHKKLSELMNTPAFLAQQQLDQQALHQRELEMLSDEPKRVIYKIPIVFHILHTAGIENISREQVLDAVAIINRDYRLQNADAAQVHNDFNANNPNAVCQPWDVEIEFVLATKAPNGACFGGITRTYSSLSYQGANGAQQVDAIVAGNDVYQGEWPGNRYLNIFVCGDIGGAAGYTFNPSNFIGTNMRNGIWMLHNYTGSIGTSSTTASRALTHEIGHWLNLSHTWGGTNDPMIGCGSDGVNDTPETRGVTSCNLNENFCGPRANVENYMDYSYCSKMFTEGQVARMRAAATSTVGGRNNLITNSNLNFTGTNSAPTLCSAHFSAAKTVVCTGESLQFTDQTYNESTGWNWTFEGGTPATSTAQNPLITYNTPGTYAVTLTATDGTTSDDEVKSGYIVVLSTGETVPFFEGFETISNLANSRWFIDNPGNNATWAITNTAANSGNKSVKLANYSEAAGSKDELISSAVNLSGITAATGVTLSFRYAYRKTDSSDDDYLKVFLTNDCGTDWVQRKTMHSSTFSNQVVATDWTPGAADWGTVHMTNVTATYWVDKFRFKFRFEGDGGNNVFLDDINIYAGPPSNSIVLGISETMQLQNAIVFPNPAEDEVNVRFSAPSEQTVVVTITDLLGNVLQKHTIKANEGDNLVMMSTDVLAAGMYMIRLNEGNQSLQFVVK